MSSGSRRGIALAVASLVWVSGCGESDCAVAISVSDAIVEQGMYESTGENLCSHSLTSGLVILEFYRDLGTGVSPTGSVTSLQINVQAAELADGFFPATVVVGDISRSFSGDPTSCTVGISELEREPWTVTDYLNFRGALMCTQPLTQIGGGGTLLLGPTEFRAHVLEE